jgi:Uma2 family endonuclease
MSMPTLKRQWTVADLADLPDDGKRYEVIDGELLVTPAPTWAHQAAVGALFTILTNYVRAEAIGYAFVAPADVLFSPRRAVQPDLFVVPPVDGRRPENFAEAKRLLLAVEVLSSGTGRSDRVVKRTIFREECVEEYWIVDLESRTFERSTPADPRVEVLADELSWHPEGARAPLLVDLTSYFADVLNV